MSSESPAPPGSAAWFLTTHWSVVLSARDPGALGSRNALETLCRTYWYPLYAYARRCGHNPADSEDLTQGFFAKLLEKDYLKSAAKEKGRFRTFLLVALKRYIANEWDREHAQKRGGFAATIAIDADGARSRFASIPDNDLPPDRLYDQQWAATLLERTLFQLKAEYATSGRTRLFETLKNCVAGEKATLPYSRIAIELKLTEAAVKMAVLRLRNRYREILRQEIAQTVSSPVEIEEEMRQLFSAFSG